MADISGVDIASFLRRFRRGLATLPADIRADLVAELRSHLEERSEQGTLDLDGEFGSPEAYAASFVAEQRLRDAVTRGTTAQLVMAMLATVRTTALALFVVLPLATVEITALALVAMGLAKPFFSDHIGLFLDANGGFGGLGWISDTNGMHEILGYWAVPIFIFGGLVFIWIGNRLLLSVARRELALIRNYIR